MPDTRELGPLVFVAAEAIGQPGQRRFRLQVMSEARESASLWLEKEQLSALGDAIETVLNGEEYVYQRPPLDDAEPEPVFPLQALVDFRVGQLSMGVNREAQHIVLIASEATDEQEAAGASVSVEFDYRRGFELSQQIAEVVAAGRPPCPLCKGPMDPAGHVCVRSNGHHPR